MKNNQITLFKQKDFVLILKELIYFMRFTFKRKDIEIPEAVNKQQDYKNLSSIFDPEKNTIFEYINIIPLMLTDLLEKYKSGLVDEKEVQIYVEMIVQRKEFLSYIIEKLPLEYKTIHTELNEKELAKAVLYYFEKDNFNHEPTMSYLAPLQTNFRNMIDLLGLSELDYEQLWEEFINPTLHRGDYYNNTSMIIFELLRKKKMLAEIKLEAEMEKFNNVY